MGGGGSGTSIGGGEVVSLTLGGEWGMERIEGRFIFSIYIQSKGLHVYIVAKLPLVL